jgi:hypothetical protein
LKRVFFGASLRFTVRKNDLAREHPWMQVIFHAPNPQYSKKPWIEIASMVYNPKYTTEIEV